MVGEEKRHQMMQNLFGDQSEEEEEEEEEVESEHESNRQPDYATDEGDGGAEGEGEDAGEDEGEAEAEGEAELESEGEPQDLDPLHGESEGERDKSSQDVEIGDQREDSEERYSESDDQEEYNQRVVTSRRRDVVDSGSERSEQNRYVPSEDDEVNQARSPRSSADEKDENQLLHSAAEIRDVFGDSDDEGQAEYKVQNQIEEDENRSPMDEEANYEKELRPEDMIPDEDAPCYSEDEHIEAKPKEKPVGPPRELEIPLCPPPAESNKEICGACTMKMEPKTPPNESRLQSRCSTPLSSSSSARLWRPAAQRNLKNQWSKLNSLRHEWRSATFAARSHGTAIVNSYLSQKYMDGMDFGVLSDMPNIREKACYKLFMQQELYRGKLLSSYREMVALVNDMVNTCKSMRYYFKGTSNSPLAQFSSTSKDDSDKGDCGGIPVFKFHSIASFEKLAWEVVRMFIAELNLKRLLMIEFLSICCEKVAEVNRLHWSDELYDGEFNDLSLLNLSSKETCQPVLPCLKRCKSSTKSIEFKHQQDRNVLQVYLTTWLAEVNIDRYRVDDIFAIVGGEMHFNFLETSG